MEANNYGGLEMKFICGCGHESNLSWANEKTVVQCACCGGNMSPDYGDIEVIEAVLKACANKEICSIGYKCKSNGTKCYEKV
jgi:hypothetical protein